MESVGAVLSTVIVAEGPAAAAWFVARSLAVFAAIEMPMVPSPVIDVRVTVLVAVPVPVTATDALADPVLFSVIFPATRVTASAFEYVIVYVIVDDEFAVDADAEEIAIVGALVS